MPAAMCKEAGVCCPKGTCDALAERVGYSNKADDHRRKSPPEPTPPRHHNQRAPLATMFPTPPHVPTTAQLSEAACATGRNLVFPASAASQPPIGGRCCGRIPREENLAPLSSGGGSERGGLNVGRPLLSRAAEQHNATPMDAFGPL